MPGMSTPCRRMARRTAAALGALLVIGCTRAPQPPPPVSPNRAPIRVSVWLERPAIDTPVFRVNLGQQSVEVRAREPSSVPAATVVAGVPLGDRPVRAALVSSGGDTLAVVEFTMRVHEDHQHWITASVQRRRPSGLCIGHLTVAPLAAPRAGEASRGDTLFVSFGSIPANAEC